MKTTLISTLVIAALLALTVPMVANLHTYSIVITILIWIMLGHSWNLLGGYAGQVSFGHAMFLGIGAYSSMLIVNGLNLDMALTLLIGGLLAGLLSLVVGFLIFRLKGPYFALGTLAFAEIIHIVARNLKEVTNGGEGIMLMKRPTFLGFQIFNKTEYFYLALLLATLITLFCAWLMRSKTGYSFIAVRENEDSAEAMGMNSTLVKSKALFASAFLAGVAGGFYGLYNKFIDPDMTLSVHMSVEMIFVTVIGGIGTIAGPVIGSAVLISLQEYLKSLEFLQAFPSLYLIVYGLLIMLVIVYLPGGLVEGLRKVKALAKKEA
ncbi:branched-chain amino acid ABC transporter permease [Pollutimonas harenae]|uniref:Branched-chain amino acid ABC transporter permease n=1 Tax=Pollutimonas harenae TaxID=657015 RepID=A0A853H2I9_9BURK|nr:branched-chain amino acid ABC transporter permease [Pollutimonas harenae]NYT84374.1 branched-chain amino acid ABC transporter permease [Pollutimonas harenae]TEA73225.1 branched-chain amino acid ABC transporter permease [Pollutimonas harenae]